MAEQLEADLELSISDALSRVDELGEALRAALESAADTFSTAMGDAVGAIPDVEVAIDADASEVTPAIDDAVGSADSEVELDATGAESITDDIDTAVASADSEVTITADVSEATQDIEALGAASADASGGIDAASASAEGLGAAGGVATGSMSGLAGAVGNVSGVSAAGVTAVGGIAAAVGVFFNEAVEATGASQRFASVLGPMAGEVENLRNIEGLNTNLGELALTLGSDDDRIREVAARLFELANASGIADKDASLFTQQMVAMGARAVALNPNLGDVGDVTDQLSTALVRGGRFASKYGLDLNAADINARALNDTGKHSVEQLSFVEKAMAGAALASEKYGGNLDTVIAEGSENAITKQRRLKQTIVENIEALGMPLVAPIFEVMEEAIPVFEAAGRVIAQVAQSAIPILVNVLEVTAPLLDLVADALGVVLDALEAVGLAAPVTGAALGFLVGGPVGAIIGGALGIASSLSVISDDAEDAALSTSQLTQKLDGLTDTKAAQAFLMAAQGVKNYNDVAVDGIDKSGRLYLALRDTRDVFREIAFENPALAQNVIDGLRAQGAATDDLEKILARQIERRRESDAASAAASATNEQLLGTTEDLTAATNAYKDSLDNLLGRSLGLAESELRYADSLDAVGEAYRAVATETMTADQVERGRTQSVIDAIKAAQDLAGATYDATIATHDEATAQAAADAVMRNFASTMRDQLVNSYGLSAEAADQLLARLGVMPGAFPPSEAAAAAFAATLTGTAATVDTGANAMDQAFADIAASAENEMASAAMSTQQRGGDVASAARGAGFKAAGGFGWGISGIPGSAGGAIAAAGIPIANEARDLAFGTAFRAGSGVGDMFSLGIQHGINSGEWGVRQAARGLVNAAYQAAASEARAHSPSLLFAELGRNLGEGMSVGMAASQEGVLRSGSDLVRAAAAGAVGSGGGGPIVFNIQVNGVTDPGVGRAVGREIGRGAADALARRGVVVAARSG